MNVNSAKVVKDISTQLEAPNLGTNKTIININGKVANIKTNSNAKVCYNMKNPIKLNKGDKITLYQAFLNEKGLNEDTISFQEDMTSEIRFLYYKQGELGDVLTGQDDIGFSNYPAVNPDVYASISDISAGGTTITRGQLNAGVVPDDTTDLRYYTGQIGTNWGANNTSTVQGNVDFCGGAKGNLFYLFELAEFAHEPTKDGPYDNYKFKFGSDPYSGSIAPNSYSNINPNMLGQYNSDTDHKQCPVVFQRPAYGKQQIKIPAGNYSVDALASTIMEQMNGSRGEAGQPFSRQSNKLLDKLYRPSVSVANADYGNMYEGSFPYFKDIAKFATNTDSDVLANDDLFYKKGFENKSTRSNSGPMVMINSPRSAWYDYMVCNNLVSSSNNRYGDGVRQAPSSWSARLYGEGNRDADNNTYESYYDNVLANGSHLYMSDMFLETWEKQAKLGYYYDHKHLLGCKYKYDEPRKPLLGSDAVGLSNATPAPFTDCGTMEMLLPLQGKTNPAGINGIAFRGNTIKFGGTSAFNIEFAASKKNRFSFTNLHEPYKIPNYQQDGTNNKAGGQTATMYNNPYANDGSENYFKYANPDSACFPIDSQSGICVNNFAYEVCKTTDTWKNLKAQIDTYTEFGSTDGWRYGMNAVKREALIYELFTKPYDQFFATVQEAQDTWAETLWGRMGFSYDQLGDISAQVETRATGYARHRTNVKAKGIMTHNYFDYTSIPAVQGLGKTQIADLTHAGQPLQKYKPQDYYKGAGLNSNMGVGANSFVMLEDSLYIDADDLPDLNAGNSYYIIESDIVKPNYMNATAEHGTVVGFMTKQMASNDTLYSTEGIEFIMTEDKLLSEINLAIKNPDGTYVPDPILGKNSGFIFIVEKAINPETMAINSF